MSRVAVQSARFRAYCESVPFWGHAGASLKMGIILSERPYIGERSLTWVCLRRGSAAAWQPYISDALAQRLGSMLAQRPPPDTPKWESEERRFSPNRAIFKLAPVSINTLIHTRIRAGCDAAQHAA
jgi:hypothetical protein